jgi:hypothetical protein
VVPAHIDGSVNMPVFEWSSMLADHMIEALNVKSKDLLPVQTMLNQK